MIARIAVVVACVALVAGCRPRPVPPPPYEVTLRLPEEGLYAGDEMQIEFRLAARSAEGGRETLVPVRYARIQCTIDMPSMPGMPSIREPAHAEGVAGEYGVHPTFSHGGEYRLHVRLLPPAEQPATMTPRPTHEFETELAFEVADAPPPGRAARTSTPRYKLRVESAAKPPRAGEPTTLTIEMFRNRERREELPDGSVRVVGDGERVAEFDVSHERLLHFFVLRDDLGTFAHEHPDLGEGGRFTLPFTFPSGGAYLIFADAAPRGAGSQVVATRLWVEGTEVQRFDLAAAYRGDRGLRQTRGGVTLEWMLPEDPLPAGRTVRLRARTTDAGGRPIEDLEPYLGAYGHLMMVGEGGGAFVHAHPDETSGKPAGGEIEFLARLPGPGLYRGWAQLQRGGEVLTFDFVVRDDVPSPGTTTNAMPVVR